MEKVAGIIAEKMVKNDIICVQDKCFYRYAIACLLIYAINIGTMLGIAIWMNQFVECCFFLVVLNALRTNCGGVHMKNWYSCYIASCGIVVMILLLSDVIVIGYPILMLGLTLCNLIIWKYAPYVHENHSRTSEEIETSKKKARCYCVIISLISIGLKMMGMECGTVLCFCAMCLSAGLVAVGSVVETKI